MKCYKRFVLLLSLLAFLVLPILQPLNSFASETTSSGSEDIFEYTETYVRDNFNALCRYVVKQNAIISDAIIGTWDNFVSWLDSSGNGDIWEQHPHSPIRIQNGVQNVEVPTEVLNVLNQYVIYQIQQNPTQYTECYIYSYNYLNTDQFGSYTLFASVKEVMKQNNGYTFFLSSSGPNSNIKNMYMVTVDKSKYPLNFIGTTNMGGFTNVQLEHNWSTFSSFPQNTEGVNIRFFQLPNGTLGAPAQTYQQAASNAGYNSTWVPGIGSIKNTSSAFVYNSGNVTNVFTNQSENELVYVFPTINAYKNFNSGQPQPYYLTSEGLGTNMSNWQVGSGSINTGTLSSANSTYNSVINNVQSGWTAEEVLELVDKIMSQNGGSGSGSGGSSSDNPFGFLGRIGELLSQLVTGVGELLTGLVDGVVNVFLGSEDENGVRHGGLFGIIRDLISQLSTIFSTDISQFVSDIFGWLPSEIITLWTAGIMIAILFGILRIIRG